MAYRLTNKYVNFCINGLFLIELVVEDVVMCFFGTQCRLRTFSCHYNRHRAEVTKNWYK